MYIIIFRNNHRDPFVDTDSNDFIESYSSYEDAKAEAERIINMQGPKDNFYFDYKIYQEAE